MGLTSLSFPVSSNALFCSEQQDDLSKSIRLLNSLATKLKAARMRAGALNLASPEVKIHMDSAESSDPVDVEQKEQFETNSLVEEFMLLANISVARKIQQTFPMTAVLRFVSMTSLLKSQLSVVFLDGTCHHPEQISRNYKIC